MTKSSRNVSAGRMSGGQAAVEALRAEGTRHVFGLIGSATMEMFDALYDADDVSFIGVHDERTGTHMADGYARALNKPGVIYSEKEIFRVKFNPNSDLYHWACINCNGMQYDY